MFEIDTVQPAIVAALLAYPALSGVQVIAEDGTYPKLKGFEDALNSKGLAIVVWEPTGEPLHQESRQGAPVILRNYIPVVVFENPAKNRVSGGTNIKINTAAKHVMKALHGLATGVGKKGVYLAGDAPYERLPSDGGIKTIIMNYISETIIS